MLEIDEQQQERLAALEQQLERNASRRADWTILAAFLGLAALVTSIAGAGYAIRAIRDDDGGGGAGGGATTIRADLTDFAIALSPDVMEPGGTIRISNSGSQVHNLAVQGTEIRTADIAGGGSASLDTSSLAEGMYTLVCEIPGHKELGMTTMLHVGSGGGGEGAAQTEGMALMSAEEGAQMDEIMVDAIKKFPQATEGKGNQVLEPEILPDGTKHFELTASIIDWEVREGEFAKAWAYNGMVPGPRINVGVGDKVQVTLHNEMPVGTDIHWHGIDVPNDQDGVAPITQDLVKTGETYTYNFTTSEAGIGMYHAHAHGDKSVPNGLFGTMYVGELQMPVGQTISGLTIPADLQIAQDIPMVVNDAGTIGLSLNGKSFPATDPIVATEGDWIRVTYFNEGLQVHPMHLHGFEQIVVAKDGEFLDHPYAADTILVSPGERYTILFKAELAGTWVWHCHILTHVESATDGMFGMVTAVVVNPASGTTA